MRLWVETVAATFFALGLTSTAPGQPAAASLEVQVADDTGGAIPGAEIMLAEPVGRSRHAIADTLGHYVFGDLPAGSYSVRVSWPGFADWESGPISIANSQNTALKVTMRLNATAEQVTVNSDTVGGLSTESAANAGAVVIAGHDLDALPDDPNDLAADLAALAGPSAGIGDPQFFIDGFSGGRLPSKESIREVRINQNPFSAEYDHIGFGRTEILTKPGSASFHGEGFWKFSDDAFNSRNPFAPIRPAYRLNELGGDLGGPLGRRASVFLDMERRTVDDNAVIDAVTLDSALRMVPVNNAIAAPQSHTNVNARVDYQLSQRNTLVSRFNSWDSATQNAGVGLFTLPSTGYRRTETGYNLQLTETAVLSSSALNETRFQFSRSSIGRISPNSGPSIIVQDSFIGGGPQDPYGFDRQNRYEVQNSTSLSMGAHLVKFGARLRGVLLKDLSTRDYSGRFVFSGSSGPLLDAVNQPVLDSGGQEITVPITSLERYRRTLLFSNLTPVQLHQLGGGPSQFLIATGQPLVSLSQIDTGLFVQDDWRLRPNFSLSAGLRWEAQTRMRDWRDFAPRFGFAWAPGRERHPKTVIRGGAGVFYDRFSENLSLEALRYDGLNRHVYLLHGPSFFPTVPAFTGPAAGGVPQIVRQVQADLRAPMLGEVALGVERQLPFQLVLSVNYIYSHGTHLLRSRNINAPLPNTGGVRPFTGGDIYQFESTGLFNQNQIITNVSRRFAHRLSVFGYYAYGRAFSDTDGPNSFPMNQYDLRGEYGRAATDVRHHGVLGASLETPLGFRLSPFLEARSGAPVNIITGVDNNGDGIYTDRPAFARNANAPGVIASRFGVFDPTPAEAAVIIPRNYGQGPAYFTWNCRLSRTFGFGGYREGAQPAGQRYSLTLSVQVRNILNFVNPGLPVGNMSSTLYGQSNFLASASGPDSTLFGDNRRILLQLKLGF